MLHASGPDNRTIASAASPLAVAIAAMVSASNFKLKNGYCKYIIKRPLKNLFAFSNLIFTMFNDYRFTLDFPFRLLDRPFCARPFGLALTAFLPLFFGPCASSRAFSASIDLLMNFCWIAVSTL